MSFSALNWAIKQKAGSAGAKLLLLALAEKAGDDGATATPVGFLAEATEQQVGDVLRYLRVLECRRLIFRGPDVFAPACVTVVLFDAVSVACAVAHGYAPAEPLQVDGGRL